MKAIVLTIFLSCCISLMFSQELDYLSKQTVIIKGDKGDEIHVDLYGTVKSRKGKYKFEKEDSQCSDSEYSVSKYDEDLVEKKFLGITIMKKRGITFGKYYYLPSSETLRLALNKDGKPKLSYYQMQAAGEMEINGTKTKRYGVLTFDMIYGFSEREIKLIKKELKKLNPQAKLMGQANIYPTKSGGSIQLITSTADTTRLTCSTYPPTEPGQPFHVSLGLVDWGIEAIQIFFDDNQNKVDFDIEFNYDMKLIVPGLKAALFVDACKYKKIKDSTYVKDYKNRVGTRTETTKALGIKVKEKKSPIYGMEYDRHKEFMTQLIDDEVVGFTVELGEWCPPELRNTLIDAMLDFFLNQTTAVLDKNEIDEKFPDAEIPAEFATEMKGNKKYRVFSESKLMEYSENQSKSSQIQLDLPVDFRRTMSTSFGSQFRDACDKPEECPKLYFLERMQRGGKKMLNFRLDDDLKDMLSGEGYEHPIVKDIQIEVFTHDKRSPEFKRYIDSNLEDVNGEQAEHTLVEYNVDFQERRDHANVNIYFNIPDQGSILVQQEKPKRTPAFEDVRIDVPGNFNLIYVFSDDSVEALYDSLGLRTIRFQYKYLTVDGKTEKHGSFFIKGPEQTLEKSILLPHGTEVFNYRYILSSPNELESNNIVTPWYEQSIVGSSGMITIDPDINLKNCNCLEKGSPGLQKAIARGLNELDQVKSDIMDSKGKIKDYVEKIIAQ